MKKIFLFIAACMMASAMQAVNVLTCGFEVSEGWDGGFAEGWSTEEVSWGDEVFNLYTNGGHESAQCLRIVAGDWAEEDAYLNFPTIDFGEEEVECTIMFWAMSPDGASVYFGEDEIEIDDEGWKQYVYSMTVSGEQDIQLDGYVEDGQILYIDDIVVKYRDDEPVEPAEPILLTVPYANNFDTVAGSLPYGWTIISDQDWNLEIKNSGNAHSGNKYLTFIYGSPAKYAILPQYDGELSGLSISLWYKTRDHWESGDLSIGAMSDPADASTFTAIQDLPKTSTAATVSGEYAQATVDLLTAPSSCHYIAIRYTGAASGENNMVYVDDVEVFLTPETPSTDPTALAEQEAEQPTKILRDGQVVIIRGGHAYNACGLLIR